MRSEGFTAPGEPRRHDSAAWRGLSLFQICLCLVATAIAVIAFESSADRFLNGLWVIGCGLFAAATAFRVLCLAISRRPTESAAPPASLPRYTILCALHDEAAIVSQLIRRLSRIDYPADRLQGFLVLEEHDFATRQAALATTLPSWLSVFVVPPGFPRTKPRALNCALPSATGDLLTIYDAEDEPDPGQLRDAAARFAADASGRLACLQAPLRIRPARAASNRSPFIDAQFAAEYAALFETVLPGLARLGLPFPLGGTSNHFRVDVLRRLGGWDAFNVTEDADLGFRIWRHGYRLGVIAAPTWETPPGPVGDWLPQRTRWLKGYMQTFGVHTRRPWRLGWRGVAALMLTVGAGLASAALHAPSVLWIVSALLFFVVSGVWPAVPTLGLGVLMLGIGAAWASCAMGARRAGIRYSLLDMLLAPAYWSMLSLAFCHAVWRLIVQPFAWDKTAHRADTPDGRPDPLETMLDAKASDRLSAAHVAASELVA
ncbi:MAG: glycosyltransferase [Brevundimonas sp.]|nr:MAG: glycosyltransferase [Brevundimonas sp.]